MKKKNWVIVTFIASVIFLSACGGTSNSSSKAENETKTGKDYTVTPSVIYELDGSEQIIQAGGSFTDYLISTDLDSLVEHSALVIKGKIENITYTSFSRSAWMQLDVRLDAVGSDQYQPGDLISVYALGGYVPMTTQFSEDNLRDCFYGDSNLSLHTNDYYLDEPENVALPKVGEEYVCFLDTPSDFLPEGTFEPLLGYPNAFFQETENGTYQNMIGDDEFPVEDLGKYVNIQ